eukprot:7253334-Pyramimonas_sp.AAC.1
MRIRPAATPPIISDGDFSKCAICLDLFMNHDKIWPLQCGHIFHAQCWDRVVQAHVDRQVAGIMEGSACEAPCAVCRGVGFIVAAFHCAPAGGQETHDRHEDVLQRANDLTDLREELNRVTAMMTSTAEISTTTPAGMP